MAAIDDRYKCYYQCKSKRRFKSFQRAERRAIELKAYRGYPFDVYHCPHCGGFHVANPSDVIAGLTPYENRARRITRYAIQFGDAVARTVERRERNKRRKSKRKRVECEVIMCGPKGPHKCNQRAERDQIDGHFICNHHHWVAPQVAVFTQSEAVDLYRRRHAETSKRLWLTEVPA